MNIILQKTLLILSLIFFVFINSFAQETAQKTKIRPLELDFSTKGGFYADDVILEMRSPGARIYFTTDGSKPSRRSQLYTKPIIIKKTTAIRAIARKGRRKSNIKGHTFFINEAESKFSTISIQIPPSILFDDESGLFEEGYNVIDSIYGKIGANFWSKKEVKINCEIFESNGTCAYRSNSGFRLFGGMSRLFPQKSMAIIARDNYGQKRIKHRVFGKEGLKKFKFLILRNSGSDWGKAHFRDMFMTDLVKDWDLDVQDARHSHLYINGKYWGIYNIREKINRFFIAGHHDVDKDSIDFIEHRMNVKRGSAIHYQKMLKYMKENDLSRPENYAYVNSLMEVNNFMDYKIAQIYYDNQDAGGNIKFWRPQTPTGKWRWVLYDTDWGFGLHDEKAYRNNSLQFHTATRGRAWPNPPWSTFILRNLLENEEFQNQFVNRFCDYINTTFDYKDVVKKIDGHYQTLKPEMNRHLERWDLSSRKWKHEVEVLKKFAKERPEYMRMHLMEMFNTGTIVDVNIVSSKGGHVTLNDNIKIEGENFSGKYFENIPIAVRAVPNFGYKFSHWEGVRVEGPEHDLAFKLRKGKPLKLKAVFERFEHPLANQIMINEVSANNKRTGDWVELFNASEESVNLKDWVFTDSKNGFKLPNVTLAPQSYLVLCEDSIGFRQSFRNNSIPIVGDFNFGLKKKKEQLALYTNEGASVDSMAYEIEPMDSTFTMSLLLPSLDNSDFENWEINRGWGTPDSANPYFLRSMIQEQQEWYLRIGVVAGIFLCCFIVLAYRNRRTQSA